MYGLFTYMNGEKWPHSRGNVGKYSLHGASGIELEHLHPPKTKLPSVHQKKMDGC